MKQNGKAQKTAAPAKAKDLKMQNSNITLFNVVYRHSRMKHGLGKTHDEKK